MKKRYSITLTPIIKSQAEYTAKKMGMTLSAWIEFIINDKIRFFTRNADKYFNKEYQRMIKHKQIKMDELNEIVNKTKQKYNYEEDEEDFII